MNLEQDAQADGGHGRIEVRRCWATDDISWLADADQWSGLRSLAMVEAERSENRWNEEAGRRVGTTTIQRHYYLSSLPSESLPSEVEGGLARRITEAVRSHWGIENKVHWVLDVGFGEDAVASERETPPKTSVCSGGLR
ncbi:MAG: ISAs1 family transposase [Bacteroidetes bacterium]|jgi:hypothetical protein|nr:ISAs1 family transposase [Bacteroidota bacterium]